MTVTINAEYPATTEHRPTKVEVFIDDDSLNRITAADLGTAADMICDVIARLGAPGATATTIGTATVTTTGAIELVGDGNGQAITVMIDGEQVTHTDYDESGYAGIAAVYGTVAAIARKFGITLIETGM